MRHDYPPLKRFSQNFLANPFYQKKIVEALEITASDLVLEIGPGQGALSQHIVAAEPAQYYAVEIDQNLIPILKQKYGTKIKLIHLDFLRFSLASILTNQHAKFKIIGNLPYHITSPIIFKLIDQHQWIAHAVLMVQKEVARRISATHGNKDYGILSVICQTYGQVKYLIEVKRGNFYPVPEVDSAVIKVSFFKQLEGIENEFLFRNIVRQTFNYRRKMLRNSLGRIFSKSIVYSLPSHFLDRRPEDLTVEDFKFLVNSLDQISRNSHD